MLDIVLRISGGGKLLNIAGTVATDKVELKHLRSNHIKLQCETIPVHCIFISHHMYK